MEKIGSLIQMGFIQKSIYRVNHISAKSSVDLIRCIISIDKAQKRLFVDKTSDYQGFKNFCDSLQIVNILESKPEFILEALQSFSMEELMRDVLKTGSETHRFLFQIIMAKNFAFYILINDLRLLNVKPYERILFREANKYVYEKTECDIVKDFIDLLGAKVKNMKEISLNNFGYLIFDEILETLLEAGLLSMQEMFLVIRSLGEAYEQIASQEKTLQQKDRKRFLD